MAESLPVGQEPTGQVAVGQEPAGGFSFKQMLPTLVFDVGNCLRSRSACSGRLRAGPLTVAGGDDLASDGVRRPDPAHLVDAAIYARGERTAAAR
jgi:hypothetical protein